MIGEDRPSRRGSRSVPTWLLLMPYLVGLVGLVVVPAVATFVLAFAEFDLVRPPRYTGTDNLRALVQDPAFRAALTNSAVFAAVAVPLRVLLAFGLALLLQRRAPLVPAARVSVMLPTAVPELAYGLLWLWLVNPLYGPVNQILRIGGEQGLTMFGRTPPQWLTDPVDAQAAIVLMSLFTIGEMFVLFLAVRQALPPELYELALIEDATSWDVLRRITLPLMAPMVGLLVVRDLVLSLQITFVPALVVTQGGPPPYATTYLPLFVYRTGFEYLRYGAAAAATLVMFLLTVPAVVLQWRLIRRLRGFQRT